MFKLKKDLGPPMRTAKDGYWKQRNDNMGMLINGANEKDFKILNIILFERYRIFHWLRIEIN